LDKEAFDKLAHKIVFTGKIDEFYNYKLGILEYRSLHFENETLDTDNFQGNAVVNYNDAAYDFTRIIEHKHFEFGKQSKTVITKEFPQEWDTSKEAFYPINDSKNQTLFEAYKKMALQEKNVLFGGRLSEYKYYDMHQVIASALTASKKELQ
jgi:UDP-galactopyranose mutase